MTKLLIVALASMTALASYAPAQAFPVANPGGFQSSNVTPVRYGGGWHHGGWHGGGWRDGWHRGYGWRRGYGGYGGWYGDDIGGAVIGGLAAATLLGVLINSTARAPHRGNAHLSYCYSHYRSYRASDNTFQPDHGPRRQCR